MKRFRYVAVFVWMIFTGNWIGFSESIPLPEHPRPDFMRGDWINLNGIWRFQFDPDNRGIEQGWAENVDSFDLNIMVPFPWGSKLSMVDDQAVIGWYARTIQVPESWKEKRVFLIIGASDWETTVWLDGQSVGTHQGGYIPFEFELTSLIQYGKEQRLVVRVDDTEHDFKLFGKQGYGNARGIWQTPYLEARGPQALRTVHILPDIDRQVITVQAELLEAASSDLQLEIKFFNGNLTDLQVYQPVQSGQQQLQFEVPIPNPRLWSLEDPFLYDVSVSVNQAGQRLDQVQTYFGMRKIHVMPMPGTDHPYVALNHQPIYLQMTLDQAYHPDGFYTFPSDEFVRDEVLRSRRIGLNAMRVHVKTPLPRKLYWADRLGMLIMADVPNSWGEPTAEMKQEIDKTLRGMIRRDFNHPSIFSWVIFNETWGLKSGEKKEYLPETQQWVASMVRLARQLDPTRLVEDNSACLYDHVETDLNTWHAYLPGYEWEAFLADAVKNTFPGSEWNFADGYTQGNQPMLNSECGNVWGYEGSTGDVDWSWDYHIMMNAFRKYPQVCGWLYTEHHDVINEWNGYYRYDRSNKFTGFEELVPGMSLRDLHSPFYIAMPNELCREVQPGSTMDVPLTASYMTGINAGPNLWLEWSLYGWDDLGVRKEYARNQFPAPYKPWMNEAIEPIHLTFPDETALAILRIQLKDAAGTVLHRNFTTFYIRSGDAPAVEKRTYSQHELRILRVKPNQFADAKWSLKQWNVLDGLKANGAGHGFFEYRVPWPSDLQADEIGQAVFRAEVSAKQLFGKDREGSVKQEGDFMLGKGTHDPSLNPNSYPMTDETTYPSAVRVSVNGNYVGIFELPDDPADHRGILSWHSQLRDKRLREAGSYGYSISAPIPHEILKQAAKSGSLVLRLEVDSGIAGGLAIYGEKFGRYPMDPSFIFVMKK